MNSSWRLLTGFLCHQSRSLPSSVCQEWKCPSASLFARLWSSPFMFYLSPPLISLGVWCSHPSLSNNQGVCSFFAFVPCSLLPWPQVSSAGADPVGEAQSVPLFLWAQQEIKNIGTCRKFGSAFHCPFLEPFSFPTVSLYKGNSWQNGKVASSNDIMQREQGFGAWLTSSSGKWCQSCKYLPGRQKRRKSEMYFC